MVARGWGDENVLELDNVIVAQPCDYVKNHWAVTL